MKSKIKKLIIILFIIIFFNSILILNTKIVFAFSKVIQGDFFEDIIYNQPIVYNITGSNETIGAGIYNISIKKINNKLFYLELNSPDGFLKKNISVGDSFESKSFIFSIRNKSLKNNKKITMIKILLKEKEPKEEKINIQEEKSNKKKDKIIKKKEERIDKKNNLLKPKINVKKENSLIYFIKKILFFLKNLIY